MYLKQLEMSGFKSFMARTRLAFEPGMTAIVGPNGCGKSNISDALRWVLGEQSAKAMRGSKMEDVIFNGTDARKPLGMAEVSITFADCEGALNTEYHEVTVTRRVSRSGEGEYLINRAPCRLKDIRRLFMDTGIGTSSYSLMEQGRIDKILSSRPEDRRAVFEEASGITKFKSDKDEAIRKLDQTEANLLRLADVIREVKRQIGSLQRQAGKARRYQALREELKTLDLYVGRHKTLAFDHDLTEIAQQHEALQGRLKASQEAIRSQEDANATLRNAQMQTERDIGLAHEACAQNRTRHEHTNEIIALNSQRIAEYRDLAERDARDIDQLRERATSHRSELEALDRRLATCREDEAAAKDELEAHRRAFEHHEAHTNGARDALQKHRDEAMQIERLTAQLRNNLAEVETRVRAAVVRHDRLVAEQAQLRRAADQHAGRQREMETNLAARRGAVAERRQDLQAAETTLHATVTATETLQQACADLRSRAAAIRERLDLLRAGAGEGSGFPPGAQKLMEPDNPLGLPPGIVGDPLAALIEVEPPYRRAFEAAMRPWADALIARDETAARDILNGLAAHGAGSARLVFPPGDTQPATETAAGDRLIDHVECPAGLAAALNAMLHHVRVVETLAVSPPGIAQVTRDGRYLAEAGHAEWHNPGTETHNPLALRHAIEAAETEANALAARLMDTLKQVAELTEDRLRQESAVSDSRHGLSAAERELAQCEGEAQVVTREAKAAAQRLETVAWEIEDADQSNPEAHAELAHLTQRIDAQRTRREALTELIQKQTQELQALETHGSELQRQLTECRIRHAGIAQQAQHLADQQRALANRLTEIEEEMRGRGDGVQAHEQSVARLEAEIVTAREALGNFETALRESEARVESLRRNQEKQTAELTALEHELTARREEAESLHGALSDLEVRKAQADMQRQTLLDRIASEYRMPLDAIMAWTSDEDNPPPPVDTAETRMAELRAKIEAIGPVNLVAIEEYQEHEQRHTFLVEQEADLINAKQQLLEMIRNINKTTSEMFETTFQQVNQNFDEMFKTLFNGGSAKLVLVDEDDVLDSGIEIIARPPGKRLQTVSLLSGGERTMTAVALLFAIYMIKPSPFCLLDELDAALDEANIGRFVTVLQRFLDQSQFVVITHNRRTIAAANVLYGVTMQEKGVSTTVSLKFNEAAEQADGVVPPATEA